MTKISIGIAVAALGLLALACGGGGKQPDRATPTPNLTVAAISTEKASGPPHDTPTPTPLVAKPDVRLCTAPDVATHLDGVAYTGGEALTFIELRNTSRTACQIRRAPDIQFIDASGQVLPIEVSIGADRQTPDVSDGDCVFRQPLLLLPNVDFDPYGLRAGQVMLTLDSHSSSENATGTCHTPPLQAKQIVLHLADTSEVVVVDIDYAPCGGQVYYRRYGPGYRQ